MILFSVIIPTFNRSNLLTACVRSLLNQTFDSWEAVIVDDGSTDDTHIKLSEFNSPRVRYVKQPNSGAAAARNNGARQATGDYIIFLDSDDTVEPTWLEEFEKAIAATNADLLTCGINRFNAAGVKVESRVHTDGHELQRHYGIFLAGSYAIRREKFLAAGGFDQQLPSGHHTELSIRLIPLLDNGTLKKFHIPKALVNIQEHGGPKIRKNWKAIFEGAVAILDKHERYLATSRFPWLESYHVVAANAASHLGMKKVALHHGWRAIKSKPGNVKHWLRLLRYSLR